MCHAPHVLASLPLSSPAQPNIAAWCLCPSLVSCMQAVPLLLAQAPVPIGRQGSMPRQPGGRRSSVILDAYAMATAALLGPPVPGQATISHRSSSIFTASGAPSSELPGPRPADGTAATANRRATTELMAEAVAAALVPAGSGQAANLQPAGAAPGAAGQTGSGAGGSSNPPPPSSCGSMLGSNGMASSSRASSGSSSDDGVHERPAGQGPAASVLSRAAGRAGNASPGDDAGAASGWPTGSKAGPRYAATSSGENPASSAGVSRLRAEHPMPDPRYPPPEGRAGLHRSAPQQSWPTAAAPSPLQQLQQQQQQHPRAQSTVPLPALPGASPSPHPPLGSASPAVAMFPSAAFSRGGTAAGMEGDAAWNHHRSPGSKRGSLDDPYWAATHHPYANSPPGTTLGTPPGRSPSSCGGGGGGGAAARGLTSILMGSSTSPGTLPPLLHRPGASPQCVSPAPGTHSPVVAVPTRSVMNLTLAVPVAPAAPGGGRMGMSPTPIPHHFMQKQMLMAAAARANAKGAAAHQLPPQVAPAHQGR